MHHRYRTCSSNGRAMDWLHGQRWICALPIIVFWSFYSPRSSRGVLFPLDSILLYAQPKACGLLGRWNRPGYDGECIGFVRTPHAGLSLRSHFMLFFAGVQQWASLSVSLGCFIWDVVLLSRLVMKDALVEAGFVCMRALVHFKWVYQTKECWEATSWYQGPTCAQIVAHSCSRREQQYVAQGHPAMRGGRSCTSSASIHCLGPEEWYISQMRLVQWDKATIATGGCWRIHSKSKRSVIWYGGSLAGLTSNAATGGRTFDAIPQHEANQGNFQLQEGKWQPETPLKWVILIFQKWNICWNLSLTQYHLVVLPHRHAYNLSRVTSNRLIL